MTIRLTQPPPHNAIRVKDNYNMKVLLLTTHLNIGGVTSYTINLARALKNKGITVYIGSAGGELLEKVNRSGIKHIGLNVKTKFEFNPKLILSLVKLRSFIIKNNIDIVHSQTRVTQVLGVAAAKLTGVSFVSTCHGFFKKSRLGRKMFGAWGNFAIAISDAVRGHLINDLGLKKENVYLIYNGVDANSFSPEGVGDELGAFKYNLGLDTSPVIGSVSRLSPVKGLNYLLLAMKDILKELPEAKLLLVGEGPSKRHLMELARKLGIEKNVFFASSTTDTRRFLDIIDVFVFYSLEEGLGLSLLEAMACGKPCVASNVGGVSSIIEDGVTGILVPPKDTHTLKSAIIKVLKNAPLKERLALNGKKVIKNKFSLDNMVVEVINVYKKSCKK